MSETMLYIIIGLVVVVVGIFILKSVIKAIILGIVILIVFRIGWVYDADDIITKFHLNKVLKPEHVEEFQKGYSHYEDEREKDAIVDAKQLDEYIKRELKEKVNNFTKP